VSVAGVCGVSCAGAAVCKGASVVLDATCLLCILANATDPSCINLCFYVEACYYDDEDEPTCTGEQYDHFGGCLCTGS
jgi:hypothetical protein